MRWMRTLHILRPLSFRMIFLTFSLLLAIIGLLLTSAAALPSGCAWTLFGVTVVARLGLHLVHRLRRGRPLFEDLLLLPLRDLLTVLGLVPELLLAGA